jgi:chromosome segregation ATPase
LAEKIVAINELNLVLDLENRKRLDLVSQLETEQAEWQAQTELINAKLDKLGEDCASQRNELETAKEQLVAAESCLAARNSEYDSLLDRFTQQEVKLSELDEYKVQFDEFDALLNEARGLYFFARI